jgi:hypothetical protein
MFDTAAKEYDYTKAKTKAYNHGRRSKGGTRMESQLDESSPQPTITVSATFLLRTRDITPRNRGSFDEGRG